MALLKKSFVPKKVVKIMPQKRKLLGYLEDNGKVGKVCKEDDQCTGTLDATIEEEEAKEEQTWPPRAPPTPPPTTTAPQGFKKVAFPIPLENVNLLSIALCDNCITRTRGRTCLEFPDGNYALSMTMCATCVVKNRALFSILHS